MNNFATPATSRGMLSALWWGWIIAPTWWLTQFGIRYALVRWTAVHGNRPLVLGFGVLAFFVSIGVAVWACRWRRQTERSALFSFLAIGGILLAFFFAVLVLAQMLPDLFIPLARQ